MTDVFDELDIINLPEIRDEYGIKQINFEPFLAELANRNPKTIYTPALIAFVNTLGKNKSGGKNAISRLQFFLNAYRQEMALISANPDKLQFILNDHLGLTRGNPGDPAADFKFFASNNQIYTIDAKMYGTKGSYDTNRPTTNFHDADYCLVFLIKENQWKYSKKSEQYTKLYSAEELADLDPQLLEIKLPKVLDLIRFNVDLSALDKDVPEVVAYNFYSKYLQENFYGKTY